MQWEKGKRLGKGGFGEVFVAHLMNSNIRTMAVKSAAEDKAATLFAEHKILTRFRNAPGIIQCFYDQPIEDYTEGTVSYNLFMEYARGGSLTNLIGGGIPESEVRVYTRMILSALYLIHWAGYVHCDIKPDNILAFPRETGTGVCWELKIADFGLAVESSKLIQGSADYRGTTRYKSPEMVASGELTPAVDVWALGCTVLEMLTGRRPWSELKKKEEVKWRIAKGGMPEIPQWVSEEGKDFLRKCFAKDVNSRWCVRRFLEHSFVAADRHGGGFGGAAVVGGGRVLGLRREIERRWQEDKKQSKRSPAAADFPLLPHQLLGQGIKTVLRCR
ncbi:unnamed protein product [Linum tenue]|uniref:Protein kinase domain-containing protein n=2 Tax=Linum tenue TaxID=586396 RepID=A0AAV0IW19_9ROSI|nr:unnamed protein product [Linum tenue]